MTGTVAPSMKTLSESGQDSLALNELIAVPTTATRMPSMRMVADEPPPALTGIFTKWLSASIVVTPTPTPRALTAMSAALALVIWSGDVSMTSVPAAAEPWTMVTTIGPSTSACPVAVTVLGKPRLRKSPCAKTDPEENNIRNETKTANLNFILLASYSAGVYSEPAPEQEQHTTNRQKLRRPKPAP